MSAGGTGLHLVPEHRKLFASHAVDRFVAVHDDVSTAEQADPAAPGMGLWPVAKIAQVWGCSRSLSGGKVVWAVLKKRGPLRSAPVAAWPT
ncbi:hypothetical protein [Amycolatopsis sp. lyj-112]|uniref:hypothetical protein n=1 Tax=Amycolatopsis sp. lyj-112 TaxID=2789288 RepID=UPI00397C033F